MLWGENWIVIFRWVFINTDLLAFCCSTFCRNGKIYEVEAAFLISLFPPHTLPFFAKGEPYHIYFFFWLQGKYTKKSHCYPPMNRDHRRIIHELAQVYGIESVSYDNEPKRNVVITAVKYVINSVF